MIRAKYRGNVPVFIPHMFEHAVMPGGVVFFDTEEQLVEARRCATEGRWEVLEAPPAAVPDQTDDSGDEPTEPQEDES